MKTISLIFIFLAFTHSVLAKEVCFKNSREYADVLSTLPPILRKKPLYFTADTFLAKAVAKINILENEVRFYFDCTKDVPIPIEESITVCATDSLMTIHFENGKTEEIKISSDDEVTVRKLLPMQRAGKDEIVRLTKYIDDKVRPKAKTATMARPLSVPAGEGAGSQL